MCSNSLQKKNSLKLFPFIMSPKIGRYNNLQLDNMESPLHHRCCKSFLQLLETGYKFFAQFKIFIRSGTDCVFTFKTSGLATRWRYMYCMSCWHPFLPPVMLPSSPWLPFLPNMYVSWQAANPSCQQESATSVTFRDKPSWMCFSRVA